MNCYDGLISIRGLCSEEDNTLYFLDDIGVSLKMAASAADEKFANGRKLIEAVIRQSWEDGFNDITFDGFEATKTLSDLTVGVVSEDTVSAHAGSRGLKAVLDKGCKLSRFFLHKAVLHVATGGETSIILRESSGDTTLKATFTAADDTDYEVIVNRDVEDTFQVLADNTNITVYSSTPAIDTEDGSCNCSESQYFVATGSDGGNETYGISVDLQVRCDKSRHLCKFADKIAKAVQYKAAAYFWKMASDSNRNNDLLNMMLGLDDSKAITEMAWLDSTFNMLKFDPATSSTYNKNGMYQIELEKLNIPVPKCKCCMECRSDSYVIAHP